MASQQASSFSGANVKRPRVEAASWSLVEDEPDIHYDHAFSIANFRKKMQMPAGNRVSSAYFTFKIKDNDSKWFLFCFPNGMKKENENTIGLFLYLKPFERKIEFSVETRITMSIVDKTGKKVKPLSSPKKFDTASMRKEDGSWCQGYGWPKFITHDGLLSDPSLLQDDVLTFHCAITIHQGDKSVVTSGTNRPILTPGYGGDSAEQASIAQCVQDFGAIFLNGRFSDFTVTCQGRQFKCHKSILTQRSSYFNAMLSHDMVESQDSKVELKDLEADTAEDLLTFIYTGKVSDMGEKAADLLDVADKYGISGLKEMSEAALCAKMNIDNVLNMLVLADLHSAPSVKSLALKFVRENVKVIVTQEGWRKKLEKYPEIVFDILEAAVTHQ